MTPTDPELVARLRLLVHQLRMRAEFGGTLTDRLNAIDVQLGLDQLLAAEARAQQLEAALKELLAAGDFSVASTDDVAIMLRLGQATDTARALVSNSPIPLLEKSSTKERRADTQEPN